MTDKLFLDTAVFIYFLENNIDYGDKVELFLNNAINDRNQLVASM